NVSSIGGYLRRGLRRSTTRSPDLTPRLQFDCIRALSAVLNGLMPNRFAEMWKGARPALAMYIARRRVAPYFPVAHRKRGSTRLIVWRPLPHRYCQAEPRAHF